jgi:hypothetical protein
LSPKNDALSFLPINSACPDGLCDVPVEVGLFFDGTYCFPEIFSKYSPSTRRNPCDAIIFGELTALQYEELPRFNPMRITHPPGVERVSYDRLTVRISVEFDGNAPSTTETWRRGSVLTVP